MPLTASYTTSSSLMSGFGAGPDRMNGESPPFNVQDDFVEITCDGTKVVPTIDAKIEKGFFLSSDGVWTCYRRNYFAVTVHYNLAPWTPNGRLYLSQGIGKPQEQIQSMAVSLAAAVDGSGGKSIELIQHTPKRDKGPQLPMKKELLSPMPPGKSHEHAGYSLSNYHQSSQVVGPQLPLQAEAEPSQQYSPTSNTNNSYQHGFERIQFKAATANNGKRRAQQQYYHLIIELWANVQSPRDKEPRWVKVASRSSHPVVVRGRSPSHYQNEGPHNAGTSRGAGSGGGPGSGPHGYGANGSSQYTATYRNGLSGGGSAGMGSGMYRGSNTYSLDPSPMGSHSVSSASSLSGGPAELVGDHHMVDDEETKMIESHNDYQYYPAPIYEAMPKVEGTVLPPPPDRRIKEEYSGSTTIGANWQVGGCGRFQGMESSRGYYPDVQAHAAGY
ncbi:hypothetical protein N0V90_009586 [Kalmusia sp. IMI 367209]|nr:hypothetical protein N0V90_009586 [Kalmusia sp. IMI 367209]